MSTVLYNVGLLGGLEILERHCHSIDLYGEDRYFELGRDASIEYGYLDLRLRNPHDFPVLLVVEATDNVVRGRLLSSVPHEFAVTVVVDTPRWTSTRMDESLEAGDAALVITGRRLVAFADGSESSEELPESTHYPVRVGRSLNRSTGSRRAS
jgi:vancomycin resistance protein VanW